uniref:F-box domain-containing protein n=1 Tax=Oryza glumipatula TaxID=40148 RepID=A0A0E0B0C5_9ORYZ
MAALASVEETEEDADLTENNKKVDVDGMVTIIQNFSGTPADIANKENIVPLPSCWVLGCWLLLLQKNAERGVRSDQNPPLSFSSLTNGIGNPPSSPTTTVAALTDDTLLCILHRLAPADLLRAALACHRWHRVAARCVTAAPPPLLGYFFHPADTPLTAHIVAPIAALHPAAFAPLDSSSSPFSPRLSLHGLGSGGTKGFTIYDVHLGLVLLLPASLPSGVLSRILRGLWHIVGAAVLSRAHPSRLCFDAVCLTVDDEHPRAWVASYRGGECSWRALPQDTGVTVAFDPFWFEGRCVHAAGDIYWHICNSGRLLKLDPTMLTFSYLLAPSELGDRNKKFRIGEAPEDGRLDMAAMEDQEMQFWVRGEASGSDNGWFLQKRMNMRKVFDTVPGLPRDKLSRTEYGQPIYAYFMAWPPAFLAPENAKFPRSIHLPESQFSLSQIRVFPPRPLPLPKLRRRPNRLLPPLP